MANYYGLGVKATIMSNIAALIKPGIAGVVFVDYQRAYDTGVGPEKMPGAFINDVVEEKEKILSNIFKNKVQIGIVGWTRAGTVGGVDENLWAKMNTFAQAIIAKIDADPSIGNQAYSATASRITTDSGARFPVGVFVIIIEVIYFTAT
jgi:hypothetical protein